MRNTTAQRALFLEVSPPTHEITHLLHDTHMLRSLVLACGLGASSGFVVLPVRAPAVQHRSAAPIAELQEGVAYKGSCRWCAPA